MARTSKRTGWRADLTDEWQRELRQAATLESDRGPAGRAYRRRAGIVVWVIGDVCSAAVAIAWYAGGGLPLGLLVVAAVLWSAGLVLVLRRGNPLERSGRLPRLPFLAGALPTSVRAPSGGTVAASPAVPPPLPAPPATVVPIRAAMSDGWRRPTRECSRCGAGAIWDGTVGPLHVDEPGPTLGYRCVCGNRFVPVDPAGFAAVRQGLLAAPLRWRPLSDDPGERRWSTEWDGVEPMLERADARSEASYRVSLGGVLLLRVDDWPTTWAR
ncbi:MAG: hypothetical protein AB7W59_10395 [Acidimicrobiia bacterium]